MSIASTSSSLPDRTDISKKSYFELIVQGHIDFFTVWLGKSPLPVWVRIWLVFLMAAVLLPFAFLPHPFAITNLVAAVAVILPLNGRELVTIRGVNKNMGWPHLIGWIPVIVVNIIAITTDELGDALTMTNADGNAYLQARVFTVWYSTVCTAISCAFDAVDTVWYYFYDVKKIDRSEYSIEDMKKNLVPAATGPGSLANVP